MKFDNHQIIVPDVSFYQDDNTTPQGIDFGKMKSAGVAGVIIRAGQNSWLDPDFKTNWRAAKEAGLLRGSYWFYDSRTAPAKQANMWNAAIGDDLPELGLWMDFEENYKGAYVGEKHYRDFALCVETYFPKSVIGVYTARWWWDDAKRNIQDNGFWMSFPLWVAQYNVTADQVVLPRPWVNRGATFWQYTPSGHGAQYGVESKEIDLSYFNGDSAKFNETFGLVHPPQAERKLLCSIITNVYTDGSYECKPQ